MTAKYHVSLDEAISAVLHAQKRVKGMKHVGDPSPFLTRGARRWSARRKYNPSLGESLQDVYIPAALYDDLLDAFGSDSLMMGHEISGFVTEAIASALTRHKAVTQEAKEVVEQQALEAMAQKLIKAARLPKRRKKKRD